MSVYYIYAYLDNNETPYYIGKGKNYRAYDHNHNVNVPNKERIIFWHNGLLEDEAFDLEIFYIKLFGRQCDGGILQNKTKGGQGASGNKRPDVSAKNKLGLSIESRKKISVARKGKYCGSDNPNYGNKWTDEMKKRLGAQRKGSNNPRYNVTITEETRKKLSLAAKQRWQRLKEKSK